VIYLGFNETFPFSCSDQEITATVKDIRNSNTGVFIIVNIHWGDEYQKSSSSFQQNLAHKIIDAGADLIIGHHPHVVQDIGFYKGKLIFYSLGNFIFDQYFSKDTQQGLAVELEFFSDKAIYRLLPIQSHLSQPFLMEEEIKSAFLKDLAQKSSHELKEEIENGKIEIIEIKNSNP
jgi:poly-gamma-glutamate synthesis protein (capsule biosynthesis protein)